MSTDYYLISPWHKRVIDIGGKSQAMVVLDALRLCAHRRYGVIPYYAFAGDEDGPLQAKYAGVDKVDFFGENPKLSIQLAAEEWYSEKNYPIDRCATHWYVDGKFAGAPTNLDVLYAWLDKYGEPDLFVCPDTGDAYHVMRRAYLREAPRSDWNALREGWALESIYGTPPA